MTDKPDFQQNINLNKTYCLNIIVECKKYVKSCNINKFSDISQAINASQYISKIICEFDQLIQSLAETNNSIKAELSEKKNSFSNKLEKVNKDLIITSKFSPFLAIIPDNISAPKIVLPTCRFGTSNKDPTRFSRSKKIQSNTLITINSSSTHLLKLINIGFDNYIELPVYNFKEDIPELTFGAIPTQNKMKHNIYDYLILLRISKIDFVSCELGKLAPNNINGRTILCDNKPFCKYGNDCNYYHSPLNYPDTTHVKYFFKTSLCPKCSEFGDGELFHQQKNHLEFNDLTTLASYCGSQLLLIRILSQYNMGS